MENQHWADQRIPLLTNVPAQVRFLSVEPLLKKVDVKPFLDGLHWIIVGGESGNKARPMKPEWVRDIRDACVESDVPFFFKQFGGRYNKERGRELDGRTWDQMPVAAHNIR